MTKENKELKKKMSGVEEMVANLIVDQQAMVLQTQVESMGDNLCRSGLRKKLLDSFLLISS